MDSTNEHDTLGNNVLPSRYELKLEPDMKSFEYSGKEIISAVVKKSAKQINLNAGELEVHGAEVKNGAETQSCSIEHDKEKEILTLTMKKPVSGEIRISIDFKGYNNDKLYGFYRCKYMSGKQERHMLTSQFEPANARNAFPCFDEPSFKAVFDLSLLIDKGLDSVSNMPIKEEKDIGSKKLVTFISTPKMSSYLLYMAVGELRRASKKYRGIDVGLITTPGKEQYSELGLDYGVKFLEYFEKYFGIKYPLPKLDLIAIPDFAAGAMENWGAITFRETALLGNKESSIMAKQRIAEVIAHELVHQWFGDLVTMEWWNDLWLNESFANFMSYKALDSVIPEWEMYTQFLAGVVGAAFAADQLDSTHPISVKVNTPGEIDQIFDEISYNKGGAVLNMLEGFAGNETFRKGLNHYLKKNEYSNAQKHDLWNSIELTARSEGKSLPIADVARSWIDNKGFPAVHVKRERDELLLSQERFLLSDKKPDETRWLTPINARYINAGKDVSVLMDGRDAKIKLPSRECVKLNYGQTGFYRTVYPEDMLDSLGEAVRSMKLSQIDAWGIENDLYAMTKKRMYTLDEYLDFVRRYCLDARYPLNANILSHLRSLFTLYYGKEDPNFGKVRSLMRDYSTDVIKEVGWKRAPEENSTTTMVRSIAVLASGLSGENSTISTVKRMFEKGNIDPNIRQAVYGIVAWSGDEKEYKTLEERYMKEEVPEEKIRLLASLGMHNGTDVLRKALDFSLTKQVRYQDSFYIPAYVSSNPVGKGIIWAWTRKNWGELMNRFQSGTHMLSRYLENLATVNDPRSVQEIKEFFSNKKNMRSDLGKALAETLEIIEVNSKFMAYNSNSEG